MGLREFIGEPVPDSTSAASAGYTRDMLARQRAVRTRPGRPSMTEQPDYSVVHRSDLDSVLRMMRRRWRLIVMCSLVAAGAALGLSLAATKEYEATASLLFRDPGFDQKLFGSTYFAPTTDPRRDAATNVRLVSLEVVAQATSENISGPTTKQIQDSVKAESAGESDVVAIRATRPDPEEAARIATEFARQYIAFRQRADRAKILEARDLILRQLEQLPAADEVQARDLRARADQLTTLAALQTGNAELVQPAEVPTTAVSPKPTRNTLFGFVLGGLIGALLVLLFERLDRRIKEVGDLERIYQLPVLAAVPESKAYAGFDQERIAGTGVEGEAFRLLRARLRYFNVDHQIKSVLITSAAPSDGKTTVSVYLALASARAGARVLFVEADLRRPVLAGKVGCRPAPGLAEVLGHVTSIEDATQEFALEAASGSLDILTAGANPPNPSELLESSTMRELMRTFQDEYDLVIVDSPPLAIVADAIPLIAQVSGVIIVSRLGQSTRDGAALLRQQLENLDSPLLGVVANGITTSTSDYYGYYQSYSTEHVPPA